MPSTTEEKATRPASRTLVSNRRPAESGAQHAPFVHPHSGSSAHGAACVGTKAASSRAALAVFVVMGGALFRAPVADLGAKRAEFLREWAVAGHRIGAQAAQFDTFDAAGWAGILAVLAHHVGEAVAAFSRAVIARGDAVADGLREVVAHGILHGVSGRSSLRRAAARPRVNSPTAGRLCRFVC